MSYVGMWLPGPEVPDDSHAERHKRGPLTTPYPGLLAPVHYYISAHEWFLQDALYVQYPRPAFLISLLERAPAVRSCPSLSPRAILSETPGTSAMNDDDASTSTTADATMRCRLRRVASTSSSEEEEDTWRTRRIDRSSPDAPQGPNPGRQKRMKETGGIIPDLSSGGQAECESAATLRMSSPLQDRHHLQALDWEAGIKAAELGLAHRSFLIVRVEYESTSEFSCMCTHSV
jgi:hypothetical protein